jgi:hypothetical protein
MKNCYLKWYNKDEILVGKASIVLPPTSTFDSTILSQDKFSQCKVEIKKEQSKLFEGYLDCSFLISRK